MKVKSKQYSQALFELTKGKSESDIDALVLKFVENLKRNGDFRKVDEVIKSFVDIYNAENDIVEVEVVSSRKLTDEQLQKIEKFIIEKYSAKEVVLSNKIDESILGSVLVKVGEEVTDFSIGGQLKQLKGYLAK